MTPVSPSKSYTDQAYENLGWIAGLAVNAVSTTVSTFKSLLGDDTGSQFVKDMAAASDARAAVSQRAYDKIWANSPQQIRMRERMHQAVQTAMAKSNPNPTWITEAYLRDYGVLPPFTDAEKIQYSQRGDYATCFESSYNILYRKDPATGHIYNRTTGELAEPFNE